MNQPVLIIAEAGVNHNGSLERALKLVEAAAAAGADVVKFQTFKTENVIARHAPKARYQKETCGADESQFDMVRRLELDGAAFRRIADHAAGLGIEFLSTPFDEESLALLVDTLPVRRLKLPSGEITNAPLLLRAAQSGLPLIVSTGMATLGEIEAALGVLAFGRLGRGEPPSPAAFAAAWTDPAGRAALAGAVTLLHCTSEYPAPLDQINLAAMATLGRAFGLPVGYSDHSEGIAVPVAATALGAVMIEKHFTLDRSLPGPDHRASLEPTELAAMVAAVRAAGRALGQPIKALQPGEADTRLVARKSLVAAAAIPAGAPFTPANLTAKRPGTGRSPFDYWALLGRPAPRAYAADEAID